MKGLLLILVVWLLVGGPLGEFLKLGTGWTTGDGQVTAMLLLDLPFVVAFFATPFIVARIHKRPWFSIGMPRLETSGGQFGLGVAATLAGLFAAAVLASPWWWVEFHGFDWASDPRCSSGGADPDPGRFRGAVVPRLPVWSG